MFSFRRNPRWRDLRARRSFTYPHLPRPTATYQHLWVSDTWSQNVHENHQLLLHVPANIQYFALWDLPKINENHRFLLHVLTKTHIFDFAGKRCNRTRHQKSCNYRKAKVLKNDKDFHQNWSTYASEFTSKNRLFIIVLARNCEDAKLKNVKKRQGFPLFSPHQFAKCMPQIIIKNIKTYDSCGRFTKPPKTETINISLDRWQIHL